MRYRIVLSAAMIVAGLSTGCSTNHTSGGGGTEDTQAPEAPSALGWLEGASTQATIVTASWRPSSSTDVAQQTVRFYTGAGCATAHGDPSVVAGYAAKAELQAEDGATYSFDVTARDQAGNETRSACSPTVAVDRTGPAAATAPKWDAASPHAALATPASWTHSAATDLATQRLLLYGAATAPACDTPLATIEVAAAATSLSVDIPGDGTYRFRIVSVDGAGNSSTSDCSAEIVVETGAPAAATGLSWVEIPATNHAVVTASWGPSPSLDVDGQRVQFYSDGTCTTAAGAAVDIAAGEYSLAFAPPGDGLYSYNVATYQTAGATTTSGCSSALTVDTAGPAPATLVDWTHVGDTSATGEWVPSGSSDVVEQLVQVHTDWTCTSPVADPQPVALGVASFEFVAPDDGDYWFDVITVDRAGNAVASDCSWSWAWFDLPPRPATSLGFEQSSPWDGAVFTATWTPSPSADVWLEEVYLYSDRSCSRRIGEPMEATGIGRLSMAVPAPGAITYRVHSYDSSHETVSACSPALYVQPHPTAESYTFNGTLAQSVISARVEVNHPSTIYALVSNGRVYRSGNAGASWALQCRAPYVTNAGRVFVSPAADRTAYLAGGYNLYRVEALGGADCPYLLETTYNDLRRAGVDIDTTGAVYAWTYDGLKRSSDQGSTWETVNTVSGLWDLGFGIDPRTPGVMYTSRYYTYDVLPGIHRSTDGGVTWTRVSDPSMYTYSADFYFDEAVPGWTFFRYGYSADGITWTQDWGTYSSLVDVDSSGAGYAIYDYGGYRVLYRIADLTAPSWGQLYEFDGTGYTWDYSTGSVAGTTIAATMAGRLFISTNGGTAFDERPPTVHDAAVAISTVAGVDNTLWAVFEDALWLSQDGVTWTAHRLPYRPSDAPLKLDVNPAHASYAILHGEDWSYSYYDYSPYSARVTTAAPDGFSMVYEQPYGNGRVYAMDVVDPDHIYGFSYYYSGISTDGGTTYADLGAAGQPFQTWQFQPWPKAVVSPTNPDRVLFGTKTGILYEFDNTTKASTDVTLRLPFQDPAGIDVYDGSSGWTVRVVSRTGAMAESADGGRTFVQTGFGSLPAAPRRILATYDGWGDFVATAPLETAGQAAYSFDGGATWIPVETGDCRVRDIGLTDWIILFACRDASAIAVPLTE